jgi:hypothetical protein
VDPNINIEAFDENLVADDSKIKYNSELKVSNFRIYGSNKPSLFIRQIRR